MKKKLNILFTSDSRGVSGAELVMLDIIKNLDKDTFVPFVFCHEINKQLIEKVKSISKKYGMHCRQTKNTYGTRQLILTKSKWFREFLLRCGVGQGISKKINLSLMDSPENVLSYLLKGIFDTDGYVQKRRNIGITTISIDLAKCIQRALLRFGVISRIRKRPGKIIKITEKEYMTKEHYEIIISHTICLEEFEKNIGFLLKK